jgi:hypothetical protein
MSKRNPSAEKTNKFYSLSEDQPQASPLPPPIITETVVANKAIIFFIVVAPGIKK